MAGKVLKVGFAVYPSVKMFTLNAEKKLVFAKELLFGDYIKPLLDDDGAYKIHTVVKKDKKGNVKTSLRRTTSISLSMRANPTTCSVI